MTHDKTIPQHILDEIVSDSNSGDLVFITEDGKCVSDKCFVFQYLPELQSFECEKCEYSHDSTTVLVKHVKTNHIRKALYQLYSRGNIEQLAEILNIPTIQNQTLFDQTTVQIITNADNHQINAIGKPNFESTTLFTEDDFQVKEKEKKKKRKNKEKNKK